MSFEWQEWPLNGLICCCLFIRDSTILNHSEDIPVIWASFLILMSFQLEVNFKFFQCQRYITFASTKFNMVLSLYKRQHHIKSFRGHSCHLSIIPHPNIIPVSFQFQTESLFSGWPGMTGMTSEWFNMLLSLYKRQHHIKSFNGHSTLIQNSFGIGFQIFVWMTLKWLNDGKMTCISKLSFFCPFKNSLILPHSIILSSFENDKEW